MCGRSLTRGVGPGVGGVSSPGPELAAAPRAGAAYAAAIPPRPLARPARPGPAPLTSVHQFEALGFPAPLPLRELHGAAGGQGRGLRPGAARRRDRERRRGGGGGAGSCHRQWSAGPRSVSWIRRGRHKAGNHSTLARGCGRRGRAGGALPGEGSSSWPLSALAPDLGSSPAAGPDATPEPNFPLGSELGAGRAGRGCRRPGARRGPAWVQLPTRRRRR